jgi:hypothetical protein
MIRVFKLVFKLRVVRRAIQVTTTSNINSMIIFYLYVVHVVTLKERGVEINGSNS